jgi:hypothetical protein
MSDEDINIMKVLANRCNSRDVEASQPGAFHERHTRECEKEKNGQCGVDDDIDLMKLVAGRIHGYQTGIPVSDASAVLEDTKPGVTKAGEIEEIAPSGQGDHVVTVGKSMPNVPTLMLQRESGNAARQSQPGAFPHGGNQVLGHEESSWGTEGDSEHLYPSPHCDIESASTQGLAVAKPADPDIHHDLPQAEDIVDTNEAQEGDKRKPSSLRR